MRTYSAALDLPGVEPHRFSRADLIFTGVDHSGPSYTARIFFDNPQADVSTEPTAENGYAGSFTVFGHAGCVGEDDDHCNPAARTVDEFDRRLPHPLLPRTKAVTVTGALNRRSAQGPVVVTVVAVQPGEPGGGPRESDVLSFERVRLATYQHDQEEDGEEPEPED